MDDAETVVGDGQVALEVGAARLALDQLLSDGEGVREVAKGELAVAEVATAIAALRGAAPTTSSISRRDPSRTTSYRARFHAPIWSRAPRTSIGSSIS